MVCFFANFCGLPGNIQLPVKVAKVYICVGNRGDEGQDNALPPLLGAEESGAGRLCCITQFAPQVDFPTG